jgi:hypothetical protein
MPGDARHFTGAKIAFNRIPSFRDFADLNERKKYPTVGKANKRITRKL